MGQANRDGCFGHPEALGQVGRALRATAPRALQEPARHQQAAWHRDVVVGVVALGVLATVIAGYEIRREVMSMPRSDIEVLDNHDPRSLKDNACADAPLSQPAYPAGPQVVGPDGTAIGTIQLRTQYSCEVIWPRVVWDVGSDLDVDATYQIPAGWTLQVLTVRPATGSIFSYPEPSSGAPVPYALGKMASTARDCVYAEVYFTSSHGRTQSARTDCVHHDSSQSR